MYYAPVKLLCATRDFFLGVKMDIGILIFAIVAVLAGFFLGWFLRTKLGKDKVAKAEEYAERIVREARQEAENLKREKLLEANEEIFHRKQELEQQEQRKFAQLKRQEKQLQTRETNLDRKVDILSKKEREISRLGSALKFKEKQIKAKEDELEQLLFQHNKRLEQISGLTSEQAKKIQLQNILAAAQEEASASIKEIAEKAKATAKQKALEILIESLQRVDIEQAAETTVSIVNLPNDDMKGRIIGREGRNIRTFEATTGIDVLIDDTPEVVMLSGFNPVRREVAKLALEKLIYDGRIHPGRIEEVVEKTRKEIEEKIFEYGEQAILEVGLHSIPAELTKALGKLRFYTSQGQNLLQHSIEVATLSGLMAAELELDTIAAKKAGLFHEIGVGIENDTMSTTAELAADIVKRYDESEVVQNAILHANHLERDVNEVVLSPIAVLTAMANEISRSRPGAKKEMLSNYIKRLTSLEEIANSFMGVAKSYAVQAGREVRVLVEHSEVDDSQAEQLARAIAKKIKDSLTYPGQIKVTVIREYRTADYAK